MFYKIAFCCLYITSVFSAEHVHLKTPMILKENVIETKVGIRPFRKTGIRIEAEQIEDKLIVHNYGYGGSGLTLAFGGAEEVLKILDERKISSKTVAVLGAGVVGLTMAYDLLENGYEVHLYSSEWSPNLTSNVAAGIWSPLSFPKDLAEEKKEFHRRLQKISEERFLKSIGESPEFEGVQFISSYSFKKQTSQESDREEVIAHFDNGVVQRGRRVYELGIEGQLFMNDLYLKVKQKGALLKECHFESLQDILNLTESVVINCTSMGSIKLFNDQEFVPVRGQLVYLTPQKEIDYLYFHSVDNKPGDTNIFYVSIYPWSDRIILGGVYEVNQNEPIATSEMIETIIKNAQQCFSENEEPSQ